MNSLYKKIMPLLSLPFKKNVPYPMIFYHGVTADGSGSTYDAIDRGKLEEQFKYLKDTGYTFISFDDMADDFSVRETRPVFISFDDGLRSNYEHAFPLAQKYNIRFSIFLEIGNIVNNHPDYLTMDMLGEMRDSGLVSFAPHTYSHIDARLINDSNVQKEIYEAGAFINALMGHAPRDFCLPFGYYSQESLDYISQFYTRIYSTDAHPVYSVNASWMRGRMGIENEDSLTVFKQKLSGLFNFMYYYLRIRWKHTPLRAGR